MGLDISVYKVVVIPEDQWDDNTDFRVLDDYPELKEMFGDKKVTKEVSYYDLKSEFEKLGLDPETEFLWLGESYGEDVIMEYGDPNHDLFECFLFLRETHINFDNEDEFKQTPEYNKYKTEFYPLLERYGFIENFEFGKKSNHKRYYTLNHVFRFVEDLVKIQIVNPGTVKIMKDCIVLEEVGYQRKGANKRFYNDGMWDSPCVVSADVLNEHHEKYFSYSTPDVPNAYGSGLEYQQENEEMKENFQQNIINNFVEGETYVIYH